MNRLIRIWLVFTAIACGAVVMAVELLGARMLSVGYGGSLAVWAAMISVTLISLAAGYFIGGALADRRPKPWLLMLVVTAASGLVAASPHARPILRICYNALGLRWGALASSALVFLLPLVLFGMVSPFVIRVLSDRGKAVGLTAGGIYALSTVGSVIGTLVTGLWVVPEFGVEAGFRWVALITAGVGVLGLLLSAGWRSVPVLLVPAALWWLPSPESRVGRTFTAPDGSTVTIEAVRDSSHGRIVVMTKGREKLLVVNGIRQTGLPPDLAFQQKGDSLRSNYFQELIPYIAEDPAKSRALLIGLAGGMTAQVLRRHGMPMDCVDLDPEIIETAREHFGFTGEAIVADGRLYLEDTNRRYDFVVIDTYSGDVFPFYLATVEAFRAAKRVLNPGGVLVLNYIGRPGGKAFASVRRTLHEVFEHTLAIRGVDSDACQTITVFAADRDVTWHRGWMQLAVDPLAPMGGQTDDVTQTIQELTIPPTPDRGIVLTDDRNPVERMRSDESIEWRRRTIEDLGEAVVF
jgi:MFS family permease